MLHTSPSVATEQVSAQSNQRVGKRCLNFQDGGHLGFSMRSVFSYFVSTKRPYAHYQVYIQLDYTGDVQNTNF